MESLQVCDYMNHHPVKLTKNMPVAEAVERLLQRQQSGGPVLDEAGKLCGFLSEQDCIKAMVEVDLLSGAGVSRRRDYALAGDDSV